MIVRKRARCSCFESRAKVKCYLVGVVNSEWTRATTEAGVGQFEELVDCQPVQLGQRIY